MNYYMDFDRHLIGQRNGQMLAEVRSMRLEEALRHNKGDQGRKEKRTMVRSAVSKVMLAGRATVFMVALAVALVLGVATTALAASVVDQQNLTHDGFIGAANNQQLV